MDATSSLILISVISLKVLVRIASNGTIFPNAQMNVKSWTKFMN